MWNVFLKQYFLGCLAHASYLIGDEETRTAVVVDPQRDVDQYLEDAKERGLEIRHVFLTHFHADFLAGHLELRDRVGAGICLGARAEAEFDFTAFGEGDELTFGQVRLEILETPGHTPEGISILVFDLDSNDDHPKAVLTGDTLFIGDVGRPDLMASIGITAEELAGMLFDSVHNKLMRLPDETLVYPAHGAGSLCGRNMSRETVSTMGDQRRYNYALQPMSKDDFVRLVTADQPEAPDYFAFDADLNRRERVTLEDSLEQALRPLALEEVMRLANDGAQLVDTRDPIEFAAGHLAGSTNIGLGGQYATWSGTLLERSRPIVIITDPGKEEESALRLGRIGFDHVTGYLEGGPEAMVERSELVATLPRVTALTLAEMLEGGGSILVLDVRTPGEWEQARIPGSLNIPLNRLPSRLEEVPRGREIVVQCASGYRSSIGASLLLKQGYRGVSDLVGGMNAWQASQLEMQTGA
jgi:glyoxylase-like metal-dependent hydrolase (beta-lactamase superfamily II)/rhodanese-related sulfurtransferase